MNLDKVRQALVEAEAKQEAIGPVSDMVEGGLSLDQAHEVCEANIQARLDDGETHVGYKVGFTNIPVRDDMGLPDSTYGYLLDSMILASGGTFDMDELIAPKIECEICFKLKAPLSGKDVTREQVLAATEGVRASFEICDARIRNWECPYPDFFADNGFSARVILGEDGWMAPDALDLLTEGVVLTQDGQELARGQGKDAMGHPANAVSWLAGKLADRGKGLEAGDLVMTGTLTPILAIERGSTYRASFLTLGDVVKTFA